MVARVRYQADVEGLTSRHPDSDIRQLINDSWQTLRELVTEHGSPLFLKATSGTMTAGAIVPDASGGPNLEAGFGTINLPADCLRVHGVDVEVNGQLLPLEPLPFNSRDDWQDWWGNNRTDAPFGFVVYDIGQESTTTVAAGKIALLPAHLSDYIIVHELCHLAEMNHSPRFWALVAKTIPNHREIRKELRGELG